MGNIKKLLLTTFLCITWTVPGLYLDCTWTSTLSRHPTWSLPGVYLDYLDFTWSLPRHVGECKVLSQSLTADAIRRQ